MMLYVVITFLCFAILFYLLFGGADFGAGIIELFTSDKNKERTRLLTYKAIGPIWEANHMWLIIVIVILFVGFPPIYYVLSVNLHIPLVIMLLGIVARGTAFIFRHYDAVIDGMQKAYNIIFVYSSFITPLFLGIIAGTLISGNIDPQATGFLEAYIQPWLHFFPVAVGIFTVAICGFLASVYLVGEADDVYSQQKFIGKAKIMNAATVVAGGVVFIASEIDEIHLFSQIISNAAGLAAIVLATLALFWLWPSLNRRKKVTVRILAGFQVSMILFAVGAMYLPDFVLFADGSSITLTEAAAEDSAIAALAWALLVGSVLILPSLFYLVWSFQKNPVEVH